MAHLRSFFSGRAFWLLEPDQTGDFVVAGRGSPSSLTYVTASLASDGSWGAIYLPSGAQPITVNASRLSGPFTSKLYNPRTGSYANWGRSPNGGTKQYVMPDSSVDWVLVLESLSGGAHCP